MKSDVRINFFLVFIKYSVVDICEFNVFIKM